MKKILMILFLLFFFPMTTVLADQSINVRLDGVDRQVKPVRIQVDNQIVPLSVPSFSTDGRIVVPVRFLAENLGAEVKWIPEEKKILIITLKKEIALWVGKDRLQMNNEERGLDQGSIPKIAVFEGNDARTMVPLRAIGEILGYEVGFDNKEQMGILKKIVEEEPQPSVSEKFNHSAEILVSNGKLVFQMEGISNRPVDRMILENPYRLVFDIPNYAFAPGKMELETVSYQNIKKVRISHFQKAMNGEPDITRVVFDLNHWNPKSEIRYFFEDNCFKVDIRSIEEMVSSTDGSSENTAIIQSPTEEGEKDDAAWKELADTKKQEMKLLEIPITEEQKAKNAFIHILIDPGHGGRDPGTISKHNKKEKDFALPTSLKLRDELTALGFVVFVTRDRDNYPTLMERADMANALKTDIFISMHANAVEKKREVNGIEVWYSGAAKMASYSELERQLALKVKNRMIEATHAVDRGVRKARHVVTLNSKMAAILIESGFLSNPMEEILLFDEEYQNVLVRAIAAGVYDYTAENRSIIADSKKSLIAVNPQLPTTPTGGKRVKYRVNADALFVREQPGLRYKKLGKVYEGDSVTVEYGVEEIQKDGYTWLYTTDNSGHLSGWLAKEFLTEVK